MDETSVEGVIYLVYFPEAAEYEPEPGDPEYGHYVGAAYTTRRAAEDFLVHEDSGMGHGMIIELHIEHPQEIIFTQEKP